MNKMPNPQANMLHGIKHVLVVDDDELVRIAATEILTRFGCRVTTANNGIEAIDAMAIRPADLVILDILMPEKEGLETLLELKRRYTRTKFIVISSGGRKKTDVFLLLAEKFGADAVLMKPIRPHVLLKHIVEMIELGTSVPASCGKKSA